MNKRSWTERAEEEAVTPVIATILLVAVTVVLAAIVYFMALAILPQSSTGALVSLNASSTVEGNNYTVEIIAVTDTFFISDARVLVKDNNGNLYFSGTLSLMNGTWLNNTRYNDVNGDGQVSPADYFQLKRGTGYFISGWVIEIYHINSQSLAGRATLP
ncbi:MAG: archaellin/type IV pilin N-terminal domain-containing protein [Thermoplasmata archaeon]